MKTALAIITFILASVIVIEEYRIRRIESAPVTVTVIRDTVTVDAPVPVSVAETGQIRTKLPVVAKSAGEPERTAETGETDESPPIDNLPAVADSAEVIIPISTKVYEDSLYRAVVSGYNASLDSIRIYRNTVYVDHFREVTKKVNPGRWSFGVQVGYGMDFKGLHPYFGIGIGYRLFEF
jgi:hypothetical protein